MRVYISNPMNEEPKDAWWHYRAALALQDYPKVATDYLQKVLDDPKASNKLRERATEALQEMLKPSEPTGRKIGGYGPNDPVPF